MKIELCVRVKGRYLQTIGAAVEVPELYRQCFEPLRICDDRLFGALLGEASEAAGKVVMRTREDAADILARKLANLIVREMKRHDTHNGYKEKEDE